MWKFFCAFCAFFVLIFGADWKCTSDFCLDEDCPDVPKECYNASLGYGIIIRSPTVCNCCELCIKYLNEGEYCTTGNVLTPFPSEMCGPQLTCNKNTFKCETITDEISKFDPLLNENRYNASRDDETLFKCKNPVTNDYIFGSFTNNLLNKDELQCECSLKAEKAQDIHTFLPFPTKYFQPFVRCLSNGQFDQLQCFDDLCTCVDQVTGEYFGTPHVHISALSIDNPYCYKEEIHINSGYYEDCEKKVRDLLFDSGSIAADNGSFLFPTINYECCPDGTFKISSDDTLDVVCQATID